MSLALRNDMNWYIVIYNVMIRRLDADQRQQAYSTTTHRPAGRGRCCDTRHFSHDGSCRPSLRSCPKGVCAHKGLLVRTLPLPAMASLQAGAPWLQALPSRLQRQRQLQRGHRPVRVSCRCADGMHMHSAPQTRAHQLPIHLQIAWCQQDEVFAWGDALDVLHHIPAP
jgi:hypothetical protein